MNKKASTICLLQTLKKEQVQNFPFRAASLLKKDSIKLSVLFTQELSDQEITTIEDMGMSFTRIDGHIIHFNTIYIVTVPWDLIDLLAAHDLVERIESTWTLGAQKPLDVSIPEIRANDLWHLTDTDGKTITGNGIIIADFDSGIDVFHPLFWKADGDTYEWIDVDGNGAFNEYVDGVDLNANGIKDSGETLGFIDASVWEFVNTTTYYADVKDEGYQADVDWLYVDMNNNGKRDFGIEYGFTENDPTFGEQIFVLGDTNTNREPDPGEKLIALRTSKIISTLNQNSIERQRGQDLISTETNPDSHGTGVCGILCGGLPGMQKYTGVAPDAELLVQNIYWGEDYSPWAEGMAWAEQKGARVMLHEIGSWVFEFLDGSSNIETAIDAEAEKGIVQVVPAGNLGGSGRHAHTDIEAGQIHEIPFHIPRLQPMIRYIFMTILWRNSKADLSFSVRTPFGIFKTIPGNNRTVRAGLGAWAWSFNETSSRGTKKFDIVIYNGFFGLRPLQTGTWTLQIENPTSTTISTECYVTDEVTSWSGGVRFLEDVSDNGTVDFPATADSAITVASYSTRGIDFEEIGLEQGGLSGFSSRGKRIDGNSVMDIAAPGNTDVFSALAKDDLYIGNQSPMGSYFAFGGTSAAGPHVAGVAALLLQAFPEAGHFDIKEAIQQGARLDVFTGEIPNNSWGYGKLDAKGAFNWLQEYFE